MPLLLPAVLLLAPLASAATAPASASSEWVDATFDLTQTDLRNLALAGTLDIHQLRIDNVATSAKDLAATYSMGNAQQRAELLGKIQGAAQAQVEAALAAAFPTASRTVNAAVVDATTLVDGPARTTYEPVRMTIGAQIVRSAADAGTGSLSDEAVAAAFHAGARVTSSFTLSSQPGYDTTYVIHPPATPAGLVFSAPTVGSLNAAGDAWTILVPNALNATSKSVAASVTASEAGVQAPTAESVENAVVISLGALQEGKATLPVHANVTTTIRALDVQKRFPSALPSNVQLAFLSADGLRALHEAGAIDEAQLDEASDAILSSVRGNLAGALGANVASTGGFDEESLHAEVRTPYGSGDPLLWRSASVGAYEIPGEGAENADLALRIGATVAFDLTLRQGDKATTITLQPPPGAKFLSATGAGGQLSSDGRSATFRLAAAPQEADVPVRLAMRDAAAPEYAAQEADLEILVDLKDLDVTIGKALGGDFGTLDVAVTVTGKLGVLEVPDDVRSGFSDAVTLDYVNADGLRLLKQRGLLDAANLTKLEDELRARIADNLASALGQRAEVTGGLDAATLDAAQVGATPSADKPVTFTAHAAFKKPLSGGSSSEAAIALYTVSQPFTLPKVQGLDTTYTVVLPSGLAVKDLQVTGGNGEKGTAPDGREQFVVTPTAERADVTVAMAVTPSFVLAKFWPIVLLAVVLVILIVGTPIALVVSRRKKKAGAAPPAKKG